ncbi:MAG TPA: hypothetical protein VLT90_13115 [Terriglobales bacterium]|nr:hypothetical protein [Terriglobales bacterium]
MTESEAILYLKRENGRLVGENRELLAEVREHRNDLWTALAIYRELFGIDAKQASHILGCFDCSWRSGERCSKFPKFDAYALPGDDL